MLAEHPDEPAITELNLQHALVKEHGKVVILTERFDAALNRLVLERSSAADLRLYYRNRFIQNGKRQQPLGDFWLESPLRRQYREVVFDPSPDYTTDPEVYNLFRGFPVTPTPGKWTLFREHLQEVGAAGDDETFQYLMHWFAWLIVKPHKPPETAICWKGAQGAGKSYIARVLGRLLGQHFVPVSNVRHLVGNFNAHLQDALLVFSDEAFWAGDRASEGALKTLITEPHIVLERKGRDALVVPNYVHLMMATNNDWAVPVGLRDRRFCVVDVPDTYVGKRAHFEAIEKELAEGGLAGLMWDLQHMDASRPPKLPKTAAAVEAAMNQKIHSMQPHERWWFEKLTSGAMLEKEPGSGWLQEVRREELHNDYLADMEKLKLGFRKSRAELGLALHQWVPSLGDKQPRRGLDRYRVWVFPTIELCRESFEKAIAVPGFFSAYADTD